MRRAVVLLSLALVTGGLVAAPAVPGSAAGTFTVSLASSKTRADVGQTTTLTGKVGGKGAAGKTIALDVRVGGTGAWSRVATVRTTSTGTFRKTVRVSRAGALTYRAVAPKAGSLGTGVSKPAPLTGYRWLDLYDESYLAGGGVVGRGLPDGTTFGGKRPSSRSLSLGTDAYVYWNLSGTCDQVVAQAGATDSDTGSTRTVRFESGDGDTDYDLVGGEGLKGYADLGSAGDPSLFVRNVGVGYLYLVTPRAHCAADRLPVALD